jgi:hypothetical protein
MRAARRLSHSAMMAAVLAAPVLAGGACEHVTTSRLVGALFAGLPAKSGPTWASIGPERRLMIMRLRVANPDARRARLRRHLSRSLPAYPPRKRA